MLRSLYKLAQVATKPSLLVRSNLVKLPTISAMRNSSSEVDPQNQIAEWVKFFENTEVDNHMVRIGFEDLMKEDCYLEPEIIQSALYAARRIDNLPLAMRILELVRVKCRRDRETYNWTMQELQPTLEDLGLKTVEEYGLNQISLD